MFDLRQKRLAVLKGNPYGQILCHCYAASRFFFGKPLPTGQHVGYSVAIGKLRLQVLDLIHSISGSRPKGRHLRGFVCGQIVALLRAVDPRRDCRGGILFEMRIDKGSYNQYSAGIEAFFRHLGLTNFN